LFVVISTTYISVGFLLQTFPLWSFTALKMTSLNKKLSSPFATLMMLCKKRFVVPVIYYKKLPSAIYSKQNRRRPLKHIPSQLRNAVKTLLISILTKLYTLIWTACRSLYKFENLLEIITIILYMKEPRWPNKIKHKA
jgi:hypothetical protein